jgi:hypothetical protein
MIGFGGLILFEFILVCISEFVIEFVIYFCRLQPGGSPEWCVVDLSNKPRVKILKAHKINQCLCDYV